MDLLLILAIAIAILWIGFALEDKRLIGKKTRTGRRTTRPRHGLSVAHRRASDFTSAFLERRGCKGDLVCNTLS